MLNMELPSVKFLVAFAALVLTLSCWDVSSEMVKMKIVEEPSSYGVNNAFNSIYQPQSETLKARVKAANFSGPPHLKRLLGKCFTRLDNQYKYEFCPFFNLTQHEQSYRWNPYSGVLGVWQEWQIANNTFKAMVMRDGDSCGEHKFRSAKVVMTCGKENTLANVTEPEKCHYLVNFTTPLVCHPQAMLVYPRLPLPLQQEWNILLGEVEAGLRTPVGLERGLQRLFEEAGFYLTADQKAKMKVEVSKGDTDRVQRTYVEFYTLDSCTAAHRRLKDEHEKTKEENEKLKKKIEELKSELQTFKNLQAGTEGNAKEEMLDQQMVNHSIQQSSQMMGAQQLGLPQGDVKDTLSANVQSVNSIDHQQQNLQPGNALPVQQQSILQQQAAGAVPVAQDNNLQQEPVVQGSLQQRAENDESVAQGNSLQQLAENNVPIQDGNNPNIEEPLQ